MCFPLSKDFEISIFYQSVHMCFPHQKFFKFQMFGRPRYGKIIVLHFKGNENLEDFKSLDIVYYGNVTKPLMQCVSKGL